MFSFAVKLKLVSHHAFDICEDALDEMNEALAEERTWPIGSIVYEWLCKVRPFRPLPVMHGSALTSVCGQPAEVSSVQDLCLL